MSMDNKFTCIDLFAGIGGFRLAAERCGGKCIGYSEIYPDAVAAYEMNYPDSRGMNLGDITKITTLPSHDLLTGGVPCQSWSIAGKNLGFDDDRGQLWNDALYLLNHARPKAFIFENVKGLSDPRNCQALKYIQKRISDAGYYAGTYVLNSFDYGVPQSRVRIYLIGFREKKWFDAFRLPQQERGSVRLCDIIDGMRADEMKVSGCMPKVARSGATSLSKNNNGYNDYFLFNDLRNGNTTIHSWDIQKTSAKEKHICLLLLKNRRKDMYGNLDGNPLSLQHFQQLDSTISETDILRLCKKGIIEAEIYSYRLCQTEGSQLSEAEKLVLECAENGRLIPDVAGSRRDIKVAKIPIKSVCATLCRKGVLVAEETRYDFRNTKISTGLGGVNRIFLPSSNIFPTLVASDTNDYITDIQISADDAISYREKFLREVFEKKLYRKISKIEACRIQGFPDDFILPESRPRWMHLIGNSVAVHLIQKLVQQICNTGVFGDDFVCRECDKPFRYEEFRDGSKQMLLAVERKKAKMGVSEKKNGRAGKAYSRIGSRKTTRKTAG